MKPELDSMTAAALDLTRTVTKRWPSRIAGTEACLSTADYLKTQLETFCDSTDSQDFEVRPGAFLGYIRLNILLYLLALLALFFQQLALATAIVSLSVLITVLEFFIYKEFVDFLFPLKKGRNVYGRIEPSQEVKQCIIISAHHDSAHIFNFLENNPASYNRKVIAGTATQLGMFLICWGLYLFSLFDMIHTTWYWVLTGIMTISGLNLLPLWFFYSKEGTPGAGDNMVCTALAIEIGKYFSQQKSDGKGLKHTRLLIASWDAEECGLRGARAYIKQQQSDLQKIKTYNFNLECMYDHEELHFLRSDLNNFVSLSSDMAAACSQTGQKLGYPIDTVNFPFLGGGTDAVEFAKAGVEATTLVGMNWTSRGEEAAYHTTRDTIEAVDPEAVRRSIAIGIQYVIDKDLEIRP